MEKRKYTVSLLLMLLIGAMNSYTYFMRGEVFASMHTGNLIKACFAMANGEFSSLYKYFIPIGAFMLGIITHYFVIPAKKGTLICSLLITASYIGGVLIPFGALDFISITVLAYGVGIQLQLIRKVNGVDVATTMCTGNMRSMTDLIAKLIKTRDRSYILGIVTYITMIAMFLIGVTVGAIIVFRFV